MKQMLHRFVDVKSCYESVGVAADVGHQFRKLLLKPRRRDHEEERQIPLHLANVTVGLLQ